MICRLLFDYLISKHLRLTTYDLQLTTYDLQLMTYDLQLNLFIQQLQIAKMPVYAVFVG
jgi:hypothetical protein